MRVKFHNWIFAVIIAVIFGATAYMLYKNMPHENRFNYHIEIPGSAESKEKKAINLTEEMIDKKELSDHKAKYYRYE